MPLILNPMEALRVERMRKCVNAWDRYNQAWRDVADAMDAGMEPNYDAQDAAERTFLTWYNGITGRAAKDASEVSGNDMAHWRDTVKRLSDKPIGDGVCRRRIKAPKGARKFTKVMR